MFQLPKIGRVFYGIGIIATGVHQIIGKSFLPPFPAWAQNYPLQILEGLALIFAGIIASGLFENKRISPKKTCLYLGFCFLFIVICCNLPYTLFFSPNKALRLDVWFDAGEMLALAGGAFVIAGSFSNGRLDKGEMNSFELFLEKLSPFGRIFFSILMLMFGFSHFVYSGYASSLVPKMIGMKMFWTYFVGVALICASIAISFKIWIKQVAFLLAIMLFLFFIFVHIPLALANPYEGNGYEIVRAFTALLYCGIALVIAADVLNLKRTLIFSDFAD